MMTTEYWNTLSDGEKLAAMTEARNFLSARCRELWEFYESEASLTIGEGR